jgi:hypothetical protein
MRKIKGVPKDLLKNQSKESIEKLIQIIQERFDNPSEEIFEYSHITSKKHDVAVKQEVKKVTKKCTKRIREGIEIYPKGHYKYLKDNCE